MDIGGTLCKASWLLALIVTVQSHGLTETLRITRHNSGDIFASIEGKKKICTEDTCVGMSSGTATAITESDLCTCKCHSHLPAFREDLKICIDDIHECALAPFIGGSTSQQIPFVFLPLKGQIIHPSKEIFFNGIRKPVCAISGAKFLTEAGWTELRNPLDTDVPFRLFRDEGRTFLQWVGEPDLRSKMSGRMVMVYLMCRELADTDVSLAVTHQEVFAPCVAFRVVGTPTKITTNVTEVAFSLEAHSGTVDSDDEHLSVSEYVAIGICSVLLGLIYVASVFLYLHLKKRNLVKNSNQEKDNDSLTAVEEGIVKNNPLLSLSSHFGSPENAYSDSASSDNEMAPDLIQHHDDQITAAMIHSQRNRYNSSSPTGYSSYPENVHQDNSGFECLPEENVSIVETLDDRPDNARAFTGTTRKKLYFNPAYFEPHLLAAPPPAALEFLSKIREVIAIAKQKLDTKRFAPSLLNIPEEETIYSVEPTYNFSRPSSRQGSVISLKRENSRRKSCTGCPGCEPQDIKSLGGKMPQFQTLAACQNCSTTNESKQNSIRKWLEDIPVLRLDENCGPLSLNSVRNPKRLRSPTRSLPPDGISSERALSPRAASERALSPRPASERTLSSRQTSERAKITRLQYTKSKAKKIQKPSTPPPPVPSSPSPSAKANKRDAGYYDTVPAEERMNLPPPDMIQEAIEMENQAEETKIPTLTKKQMNAVIHELTIHKTMLEAANKELARRANAGYDTDSLERNGQRKGFSTPSEYAPSTQASPSLSTALPVEEEITMQNAVFNRKTGNTALPKLNKDNSDESETDYELVVTKKGTFADRNKFPGVLQKNNKYSLVSEVYVNNGYNYSSNTPSPSESNCSSLEKQALKVRYDGGVEKPGKLLIEVEDCLDHYIPVHDSDDFDPDTLDRPNKGNDKMPTNKKNLDDSLERPNQILLRTNGSFKSPVVDENSNVVETDNFTRVFGSLRELYEKRRQEAKEKEQFILDAIESDHEGKLLTLEERHSKRQRVKTTSSGPVVPPDLIPPPPHDDSTIYEHPKPPRKVLNYNSLTKKPPLPPKNGHNRSVSKQNSGVGTPNETEYKENDTLTKLINTDDLVLKKNINNDQFVFHSTNNTTFNVPIKTFHNISNGKNNSFRMYLKDKLDGSPKKSWQNTAKPEDSGYLSTDSNDSSRTLCMETKIFLEPNGSETDESSGDGHSESGAESVETHSVFFGRIHRGPNVNYSTSMDSGIINCEEGNVSSDSESVSYTTVVSMNSNNKPFNVG